MKHNAHPNIEYRYQDYRASVSGVCSAEIRDDLFHNEIAGDDLSGKFVLDVS